MLSIFTPQNLTGSDAFLYATKVLHQFWKWKTEEERIMVVQRKSDLAVPEDKLGVILHLEGASPLCDEPELLEFFFRLGIRSLSFTHNTRTAFADGLAIAERPSGLTHKGKELLAYAEALGVAVDVSHLSEASFWSMIAECKKPIYASHSNIAGVYAHPRNLNEKQLEALAGVGGVVCLTFVSELTGHKGPESFLSHLKEAIEICGGSGVGLGSDFEGCDLPIFPDASSYPFLHALLAEVYPDSLLEGLFYANLYRFFQQILPD